MKALVEQGINFQLMDVDVPSGSTLVTEEIFKRYLNDPKQAFGHSWFLAMCLLGQNYLE
jgi:hypothetical protein